LRNCRKNRDREKTKKKRAPHGGLELEPRPRGGAGQRK